jgi:hypothetical protein
VGSGTTGGRIGANVSRHLENKYGEKGSNRGLAYFSLLLSVFFFYGYYIGAPQITVNDVIPVQVTITSFEFKTVRNSSRITLKTKQKEYTIRSWVWKDVYSSDELLKNLHRENHVLQSLNMDMKATIWLKNLTSTSILGIKTNTVSITPEEGVKGANKNNWYSLLLGIGFLGMSVYAFFKSR